MPNTIQIREERIKQLAEEFKNVELNFIDPVFTRAKKLFPKVKDNTLLSYAKSVLQLRKNKVVS